MPRIDFREIPEAHIANGQQDQFELFARDFFVQIMNFTILSEPNRGADGGKDILARETLAGSLSAQARVWLISCKHKAHSGNSVDPNDEQNITDRIKQHKADGFIGFYSTLPSAGLNNRLDAYKGEHMISIFDKEKIESYLLDQKGLVLIRRYFPTSYRLLSASTPSDYLDRYYPLNCEICRKDLLLPENIEMANLILSYRISPDYKHDVEKVYAVCKGQCDAMLEEKITARGCITGWTDISDFAIPTLFTKKVMAFINQIYEGNWSYSQEAFGDMKRMIMSIAQYVYREQTPTEKERIADLSELPDYL